MKKLVFILFSACVLAGFVILSSACEPYAPPDTSDTIKLTNVSMYPGDGSE